MPPNADKQRDARRNTSGEVYGRNLSSPARHEQKPTSVFAPGETTIAELRLSGPTDLSGIGWVLADSLR